MNVKKLLIIIAFMVFVVAMALALYWVFFKGGTVGPGDANYDPGIIPPGGEGNVTVVSNVNAVINERLPIEDYFTGQISEVANGGFTNVNLLTDTAVSGLTTSPGGLQYYDKDKNQFFTINSLNQRELLTDKKFYNVSKVNWANSGDKAVLEYPDGRNIVYNFKTDKQVTLPAELQDFSFNHNSSKLIAEWINADGNEENNWIITVNDDGSGMQLIEPIGDEAGDVAVGFSPDNQVAALYRKYIDLQRQEVFPIGLNGENFSSFTVQGAGFTSEWSPDGESLVYSVHHESTDYLPNLWIAQGESGDLGNYRTSLNLATWPDKCTFSGSTTMYCAVPKGLPRGAGLYPEIANSYNDNFYTINLNTGAKTLIANPVGLSLGYSAHNLFVSDDGSLLYFTDQDGKLQSMRLN